MMYHNTVLDNLNKLMDLFGDQLMLPFLDFFSLIAMMTSVPNAAIRNIPIAPPMAVPIVVLPLWVSVSCLDKTIIFLE